MLHLVKLVDDIKQSGEFEIVAVETDDFIDNCRHHPSLWRRIDMSYKRVDCEQLNRLLQCGTTTLKMYQTTVRIGGLRIQYESLFLLQVSNSKLISIEPSL